MQSQKKKLEKLILHLTRPQNLHFYAIFKEDSSLMLSALNLNIQLKMNINISSTGYAFQNIHSRLFFFIEVFKI